MATELQFFARHANRKIIKTEDVTLLARKHPNMVIIPAIRASRNTFKRRSHCCVIASTFIVVVDQLASKIPSGKPELKLYDVRQEETEELWRVGLDC